MTTIDKQERARKRALLALAEEMGLTAQTAQSLAMFDRRAETATAEQVRQALTDAFITRAHVSRKKPSQRHARGRTSASYFSAEDLATIARICAAAGIEAKGFKQ